MKSVKALLFSGTLAALCAFAVMAFWPAPQADAFEGAECDPATIIGPFTTSATGVSFDDCPWAEMEALDNLSINCGIRLICDSSLSATCTSNPNGPPPFHANASGWYTCGFPKF